MSWGTPPPLAACRSASAAVDDGCRCGGSECGCCPGGAVQRETSEPVGPARQLPALPLVLPPPLTSLAAADEYMAGEYAAGEPRSQKPSPEPRPATQCSGFLHRLCRIGASNLSLP